MTTTVSRHAAGNLDSLADSYLVAVHRLEITEVPSFMAEARERLERKEGESQALSSWEETNRDRILATPVDEVTPAVVLAAVVAATPADFNASLVTVYSELVLTGQGVHDAFADPDNPEYRVGRFARRHNGRFAPWDFLDAHGQDARDLLSYAREVL